MRVGGRTPDIEQDKVELEGEGWRKDTRHRTRQIWIRMVRVGGRTPDIQQEKVG